MSAQKRSPFSKYISLSLGTALAAVLTFFVVVSCSEQQAKAKPNLVFKEAPKAGIVAKIDGQDITEDQLIGDDRLDFFDLKKREYDLKMERLNKLMVDIILGQKAKAAGMSTEDYINKKVVGGEIKISAGEYKKFVADKHIPEAQINDQVKERIMAYLKEMKKQDIIQNAIAKETKANPVEVYFSKPKMQVNVEPGQGTPMWGNANAKVTVVEFSDFQCPFCGRADATVQELKKKYNGKIKLYYRNFPLPMHKDARPAAEAAMCVYDQGNDKFWKFSEILFKNQDKLDAANLAKFAKQVGADDKKLADCVASKKFSSKVQEDMQYGEKIGVRSTPTFFINGQLVSGAVPIETFSEVIDDELGAK
jgi:protein-disulfide isomerase